jgi:hypothetical protein
MSHDFRIKFDRVSSPMDLIVGRGEEIVLSVLEDTCRCGHRRGDHYLTSGHPACSLCDTCHEFCRVDPAGGAP